MNRFARAIMALLIASPLAAQRVVLTLPRDSVLVGDTIKNATATAYDTRNHRVPSAKFSWLAGTSLRIVPNGNGTTASLVGVSPLATVVTATWRRSDGTKVSANHTVRVLARPIPKPSLAVAVCFSDPTWARFRNIVGDTTMGVLPAWPDTMYTMAAVHADTTLDLTKIRASDGAVIIVGGCR